VTAIASVPTLEMLRELAAQARIHHLGVAPATIMERARTILRERRAAGLDAGMQFTYRNPERSTDPTVAVPGARSVIVGARSYVIDEDRSLAAAETRSVGEAGVDRVIGRVARYSWVDHYEPLRAGLETIAEQLRSAGHRARVFADDNAIVDREIAYRAGLGWFGKNANLLISGAGSFFVLGCVVTTADYLDHVVEPVADGCGACRRCLDGCPTSAIVAPGVVDANRCLAWLVQRAGTFPVHYRAALGDRIYGCDDCQEVCPPTVRLAGRFALAGDDLDGPPPGDRIDAPAPAPESGVDVLAMLSADDAELLERHGRWYIAERDPRWLRRNALIVIGNTADPKSSEVRVCLDRYIAGDDAVLAEHARWAAQRLRIRAGLDPDRREQA
jgi:epoxyqueuosine reductase